MGVVTVGAATAVVPVNARTTVFVPFEPLNVRDTAPADVGVPVMLLPVRIVPVGGVPTHVMLSPVT